MVVHDWLWQHVTFLFVFILVLLWANSDEVMNCHNWGAYGGGLLYLTVWEMVKSGLLILKIGRRRGGGMCCM